MPPSPQDAVAASAAAGTRGRWAAVAAILVAVWASYALALTGDFLFDDMAFVTENAQIKGEFSPLRILTSPFSEGEGYRPLVVFTLALDYALYRMNPPGFHVTNLVLHSLNSLLVLALLALLLRNERAAQLGALLFALHPVHVEPVACVSQRTATLAFLFYGIGWLAWLRGGTRWFCVSLAAYFFGLLSKEEAVTLPGALFLGEWFLGRLGNRAELVRTVARCAAFAAPLAAYLVLRTHALGDFDAARRAYFTDQSVPVVVLTMARFTVRHYLPGMLAGANLTINYHRPSLPDVPSDDVLGWLEAGGVSLCAVAAAMAFWRRRSAVAFGAVFVLMTMLPVSNLVFRIWAIGAQRYLYLPSLGFCLAAAALLEGLRDRGRAAAIAASAATLVLLVGYFALTVRGTLVWQDAPSLYMSMLEHAPDNPAALHNLALHFELEGDLEAAVGLYERAARLGPNGQMSAVNLAVLLVRHGRNEEALERLRGIWSSNSKLQELVLVTTAAAQENLGRIAEARESLARALDAVPDSVRARRQLGDLATREGALEEAARWYRECLDREPDDTEAALGLAALYRRVGKPRQSSAVLAAVLAGNPEFAAGWNDLGLSFDALKDFAGAEEAYRRAIALAPEWAVPFQNLGMLLLDLRRFDEAGERFARALELSPGFLEAQASLGFVRLEQGRRQDAVALWENFLQAAGEQARYAPAVKTVRDRMAALGEGK